jgi:hypothetical protein
MSLEHFDATMNTNSTQIGGSPSELHVPNADNEFNHEQLLSDGIVLASQSLVPLAMRNMVPTPIPLVPNNPVQTNVTTRQEGNRRRRQRQRQRRRERRNELRRQELEQRQQLLHQRNIRQQRRRQRYERWQQRLIQWEHNREQDRSSNQQQYQQRVAMYQRPTQQTPPRYADEWEEEQINDWEGFVILEQLISIQDELEQGRQIDAVEELLLEEEERQLQNREDQEQIEIQLYEASIQDTTQ